MSRYLIGFLAMLLVAGLAITADKAMTKFVAYQLEAR